jgi:hypothetical protein
MKKTELQLGNLVYDRTGQIIKVESSDLYSAMTLDLEDDSLPVTPIPLSDEMLERLNFIRRNILAKCYRYPADSPIDVYVTGGSYRVVDLMSKEGELLEYVHELQNYFKTREITLQF